jgi:hypothetical protein
MFLIERLPGESVTDLRSHVDALLVDVYTKIPAWLEYELRESYRYDGRQFHLMYCVAGSVHCQFQVHASRGAGISRDILIVALLATDMSSVATIIHRGVKTEISPDLIHPAATKTVEENGGHALPFRIP